MSLLRDLAAPELLFTFLMRGFVCLLLILGGAAIFAGYQIPLTRPVDYSVFPGGPTGAGAIMILFGVFLAIFAKD